MAKSMTIVNPRNLLAGNTFQIVTEETKDKIRRKLPAAKHYIVYPETVQGERILNQEIRKKTRLNALWQMAGFSLKQKHLVKDLHSLKPLFLNGCWLSLLIYVIGFCLFSDVVEYDKREDKIQFL